MELQDLVNLLLGVVSIVLAIVSIIFSVLFYKWGKRENESSAALSIAITEKVKCLEILFEKMYDSTYDIVRENNRAMQKHLFPGTFSESIVQSKDMEVYYAVYDAGHEGITIKDIAKKVGLKEDDVNYCLQSMEGRGIIKMDNNKIRIFRCIDDTEMSSNEQ